MNPEQFNPQHYVAALKRQLCELEAAINESGRLPLHQIETLGVIGAQMQVATRMIKSNSKEAVLPNFCTESRDSWPIAGRRRPTTIRGAAID